MNGVTQALARFRTSTKIKPNGCEEDPSEAVVGRRCELGQEEAGTETSRTEGKLGVIFPRWTWLPGAGSPRGPGTQPSLLLLLSG